MTEDERWDYLVELDDELLLGNVVLSEWCSFIVREADLAFVNSAHLACILTATSAIETYLRSESLTESFKNFFSLIEDAEINSTLRQDLHTLRKYRNKWVHVSEPWEDQELIDEPQKHEKEVERMAFFSIRLLRQIIYSNQGT